ncbi:hypothetical protein BT69DRAFT_1344894 [Atractiella rhizophila]|nr:hypothetical protein BT69DRAFT_1344894 [Atractiella rhizophila]
MDRRMRFNEAGQIGIDFIHLIPNDMQDDTRRRASFLMSQHRMERTTERL